MKLQIMSDLHLEMHRDGGAEFIKQLDPTGVDLLVLAGDITQAGHYGELADVFKPLAKKYSQILYIPGNHEYYRASTREVPINLARLSREIPGLVIPDKEAVTICGQRFFAGTMWFGYDPMGERNKPFMNDFSMIEGFEPWVYNEYFDFEKALITKVAPGDVVVTHHLPSPRSVPVTFAASALNAFFVSDMTDHILELRPKLWIHGHTHTGCDYVIDQTTRVVCNPLGYPRELGSLNAFDPAFIVEV